MTGVRSAGPAALLSILVLSVGRAYGAGRGLGGAPPAGGGIQGAPPASVPLHALPDVDVDELKREDAIALSLLTKKQRVGWQQKIDLSPGRIGGLIETLQGEARVWRTRVRSPGALWLLLGFGTYLPGEGVELYVYSEDRSVLLGKFTRADIRPHGQLWMPPIEGDAAVVELHWPGGEDAELPNVHLGSVTHGYRPFGEIGKHHTGHDGDSGACNNDINCPEGAAWTDQRDAGVNLLTDSGTHVCSASLITTAEQDCRNLVLTAAHCLNTQAEAASTVFQFNYERPGCASGLAPTDRTTTGGQLRATYGPSDMTLLEMDEDVDATFNAFYAGWSRDTAPGTESTGIHHPRGDVKKISFNTDPLVDGTNYGPNHWRITEWEQGTTEGGSSGSPLFDQDQRIIGQLHGGQASCTNITWDEYGKLSVSWDGGGTPDTRLRDWLDPDGTGEQAIDGT